MVCFLSQVVLLWVYICTFQLISWKICSPQDLHWPQKSVSFCSWSSVISLQWNPPGRGDLTSHDSALINFSLGLVEYPQTCIVSWLCSKTTHTSLLQTWLKSPGLGWHALWTSGLEDVASQESLYGDRGTIFLPGHHGTFSSFPLTFSWNYQCHRLTHCFSTQLMSFLPSFSLLKLK